MMNSLAICTIKTHKERRIQAFCIQEGCPNMRRMCQFCFNSHIGHRTTTLDVDFEEAAIQNLRIHCNAHLKYPQSKANIDSQIASLLEKCTLMFKVFEKFTQRCFTNHLLPMSQLINNSFKEDGHINGVVKIIQGNLTKDQLTLIAKAITCFERQHYRNIPQLQQATAYMSEQLSLVMDKCFEVISQELEKVEIEINRLSLFSVTDYSQKIRQRQQIIEQQALKKKEEIKKIQKQKDQISFNSKITKDLEVLRSFLQKPTASFKLLYRASQNSFLVSQFHKKCDGIPNTLVLVLTQFDKIIGGYTTLQWNSSQDGQWLSDKKYQSFLFSVTNKQKYRMINTNNTIICYSTSGPVFGGGNDLWISDKASTNKDSKAFFPYTYNNGKYNNNQNSYKAFSGSLDGCNFKIKEWQVFQVQMI